MDGNVLIVEGGTAVAGSKLDDLLEQAGYAVWTTMASGDSAALMDALECGRRVRPEVAIVLIDPVDGFSGLIVARMLRKRFNTRVLFVTSSSDGRTLERMEEFHPIAVLQVPVSVEDMLRAVHTGMADGRTLNA